jgi:hypothetical protein
VQLDHLLPEWPISDALSHLCAATIGWISLRRVVVWLSIFIGRFPFLGDKTKWITPSRIYYYSIVLSVFVFFYAAGVLSIERFKGEFVGVLFFIGIFMPPIFGSKYLSVRVDLKSISLNISVASTLAFFV